ncbi:MAG: hypothetical protein HY070_04565 [Chloroflexi bacterium]|nr:hypothetical protein [Chloroflexota bacterium]
MSRDFLLVFAGGMVSLVTTLVVLFVADYLRQRNDALVAKRIKTLPNPESNALKRSEFFKRGADAEKKDGSSDSPKTSDIPDTKKETTAADSKIVLRSEN